ncbi:MAG: hypothetical protein KatS3mg068_1324 [Candidatus Sericytochromatia bacterium]|nr:MAG: hypothetical protein KatS3mg068_1324 [Candidatus Sericytochromatia bacterium]
MEISQILKEQEFFSGISQNNINLISESATIKKVNKDNYIFKICEEAKKFYLIIKGKVSLEFEIENKIISLEIINNGEILGWSWQFPPYKWNFSARAIEDTELLEFDVEKFYEKCNVNLLLAYELQKRFSKIMLKRLQATRRKLIEVIQEKNNEKNT